VEKRQTGYMPFFMHYTGETKKNISLRKYVPLLSFLLVIVIMVVLFVYRQAVAELGNWGYLGAFLIGLVGNATVILPMPSLLLLFALGATFNPVLVGLTGAAGGAIGELSGYILGYSGHGFIKNNKLYVKAETWMKRWGSATVFVFAVAPVLPIDVAGIAAGALRFRVWKFLTACFSGKAVLYICLTLAASWGWHSIERWFA
jgi:membrane protein YqaA with SNARE-associated domain